MFNIPANVRPGEPIRAAHQNMVYDALRKLGGIRTVKPGQFQRSRAVASSAPELPFAVSVVEKDGVCYIQSAGGSWFGRGVGEPSHGVFPTYEIESDPEHGEAWPDVSDTRYDAFRICPCEWALNLGPSALTDKVFTIFLHAAVYGGGEIKDHPKIFLVEESALTFDDESAEGKFRVEAFVASRLVATVRFVKSGGTVSTVVSTVVTQRLSSDVNYPLIPNATAPFRWYRIDGTLNSFGCRGGIIRCLPTRFIFKDYTQGTISDRPIEPSLAEFQTFFQEFSNSVAGVEQMSFSDAELNDGVVVYLQVAVSDGVATTAWIVRSLSASGLSPLYTGTTSEARNWPATPDEVQAINIDETVTESDTNFNFAGNPRLNGSRKWSTCVPMALIRRTGNSTIPDVVTIRCGVVDVRPILELRRNADNPYPQPTNCEGAIDPTSEDIVTETGSEGVPQSYNLRGGTETSTSSYGLEDEELAQASAFKA